MAGFRKRIFASRFATRNVRRKVSTNRYAIRNRFRNTRSRFSRFSSRTASVNAQLGNSTSFGYRKRMIPKRAWRSALLNETRFKAHYRSLRDVGLTFGVPAGVTTATVGVIIPLPGTNPFWLAANGAQPIDLAIAVPIFDNSSIVLRGGVARISFSNNDLTSDSYRLRIWGMWSKSNGSPTSLPAGPVPTMYDPTVTADLASQELTIAYFRETFLLPGNKPYEIFHRFKPQKIDFNAYTNDNLKFFWFFTISQTSDVLAVSPGVTIVSSTSVSFAGDVLAP